MGKVTMANKGQVDNCFYEYTHLNRKCILSNMLF